MKPPVISGVRGNFGLLAKILKTLVWVLALDYDEMWLAWSYMGISPYYGVPLSSPIKKRIPLKRDPPRAQRFLLF